jgi:NADH-quinone oxidoreductase subunit L
VALTAGVLLLAVLNHLFGVRRTGRGLGAVDHIHHAPVLSPVYAVAESGKIDPYAIGRWVVKGAAAALHGIDRAFDWCYDTLAVKAAHGVSWVTRRLHNGSVNRYILWSIAGAAAVVLAALAVRGGGQ